MIDRTLLSKLLILGSLESIRTDIMIERYVYLEGSDPWPKLLTSLESVVLTQLYLMRPQWLLEVGSNFWTVGLSVQKWIAILRDKFLSIKRHSELNSFWSPQHQGQDGSVPRASARTGNEWWVLQRACVYMILIQKSLAWDLGLIFFLRDSRQWT